MTPPAVAFWMCAAEYCVVLLQCEIIQLDVYRPWHFLVNMQNKIFIYCINKTERDVCVFFFACGVEHLSPALNSDCANCPREWIRRAVSRGRRSTLSPPRLLASALEASPRCGVTRKLQRGSGSILINSANCRLYTGVELRRRRAKSSRGCCKVMRVNGVSPRIVKALTHSFIIIHWRVAKLVPDWTDFSVSNT